MRGDEDHALIGVWFAGKSEPVCYFAGMLMPSLSELLRKHEKPLPRYTSYPTVPYWNFEGLDVGRWKKAVAETFLRENGEVCLYIHLPFCEELCTYCACNKRITKNHAVEVPYLRAVLKEWEMYREILPGSPMIREIHLGGGTPTFFSPEHLRELVARITEGCGLKEDHEFSVEVHPNFTTPEHLSVLKEAGFNRISLGVQDFDPAVQFIINRIQSFEQTNRVVEQARRLGFHSVNIDLIYGLPRQTQASITYTMEKVAELMPDRIAFYSYAHVPWKSKGQRRYTDEDVPKGEEKMAMYELGNDLLTSMGFVAIGMDHFALPDDKLMQAFESGTLHRNFMGYTTNNHKLVIGLGASSIGDSWTAFAQNEKEVEAYEEKIAAGELALVNGHLLSEEDLQIRTLILDLMCKGKVALSGAAFGDRWGLILDRLREFENDGLVAIRGEELEVLPAGRLFIRNICSVFDAYLGSEPSSKPVFSRSV